MSFQNEVLDSQNCFELAAIQIATLGLSAVIIGGQLSAQYGPGTALCSILIGNLILWLVGIAMIAMVEMGHANAIQNIRYYLGRTGGHLAALVFIGAFLNGYAYQIDFTLAAIQNLFPPGSLLSNSSKVRLGAALGLFTALLSIGGIRALKWLCTLSFTPLLIYSVYAALSSNIQVEWRDSWGFSLPATIFVVFMLLPGVINFPTFFRHSISKAHSFFALSLIALFVTFFELSTVWISFLPHGDTGFSYLTLMPIFLFLILVLCNLLNIYLSSACWETIVPHFYGARGFAIIGLLGTLCYTFIQVSKPVQFFEDLTNAYIVDLGVTLLISFLVRLVVRHRARPIERLINLGAWIFGCIVATSYKIFYPLDEGGAFRDGIYATILFFIAALFLEEMLWALRTKKRSSP